MNSYNIPTKKDIDKLIIRLDRLEKLIKSKGAVVQDTPRPVKKRAGIRGAMTASDTVMDAIKRSKKSVTFTDLQAKTGFEDKKLRNIIFRLSKLGKIKRKSRGEYILA
ncbi:MAG: hypothetical protein K9L30_02865 [Desulfobacterales bacterium]|nr:hypothetical protein [Desulfobacterales bacterium]